VKKQIINQFLLILFVYYFLLSFRHSVMIIKLTAMRNEKKLC